MAKVNVRFEFNGEYENVTRANSSAAEFKEIFDAAHRRLDNKIRRILGVSKGKLASKKTVFLTKDK